MVDSFIFYTLTSGDPCAPHTLALMQCRICSIFQSKILIANKSMNSYPFLMNYRSFYNPCLALSEYAIENMMMSISH